MMFSFLVSAFVGGGVEVVVLGQCCSLMLVLVVYISALLSPNRVQKEKYDMPA